MVGLLLWLRPADRMPALEDVFGVPHPHGVEFDAVAWLWAIVGHGGSCGVLRQWSFVLDWVISNWTV